MVNQLNATVTVFGIPIDVNSSITTVCLIVIQALFVVIVISLIVYLIIRKRSSDKATQNVVMSLAQASSDNSDVMYIFDSYDVERQLVGISLDLNNVARTFTQGDEFDCNGIVVYAEYNTNPTSESIDEYTLVNNETYARLQKRNKTQGIFVIKPELDELGVKTVTVFYNDKSAEYTVNVEPATVEEPMPLVTYKEENEEVEAVAPIVIVKTPQETDRELLYISLNTDNVQKEYLVGDAINHDGLVVVGHFNKAPFEENILDYSVLTPDTNKESKPTVTVSYQDKTVGYQIAIKNAPHYEENKPNDTVTGVETDAKEIVMKQQPIIIEEEALDARLRYDKSFTARLIQSTDEIKYWYTDIKNELLSFRGVKGRISWKRETFKCGGKLVLAKLGYRGKVLCIYLPLNPADYIEEQPVEEATDSCYADTRLMIRLKNTKRVELAKELIETVMERNNLMRVPHEAKDYYLPYEGILDLINRGLVRRNIRTADEEAIFDRDHPDDVVKTEDSQLTMIAPGIYVTKKD